MLGVNQVYLDFARTVIITVILNSIRMENKPPYPPLRLLVKSVLG